MLDRFQKKYIREKMDEIGSETKILAFYNKDDEVYLTHINGKWKETGKNSLTFSFDTV